MEESMLAEPTLLLVIEANKNIAEGRERKNI
jgi:hypothetical protein